MESNIQIMEKPEWVTWDDIHDLIWKAHAQNRSKGIIMANPSLPGEEIRKRIDNGKMYVAVLEKKVVGTLALIIKNGIRWYNKGTFGYLCFGAVDPDLSGKGIYRSLYKVAEQAAKDMGVTVLTRDTNENNARMLKITRQEGYYYVEFKALKDHYNIVRAKWLTDCPYPVWYIKMRFQLSKLYIRTRFKMDPNKGKVKRFGI